MSLRGRALNTLLRVTAKRRFARILDPVSARAEMERGAARLPVPPGLLVQRQDLGRVPALLVRAGITCEPEQVVMYLHGGGYLAGSAWHYRGLGGYLSRALRREVVLPEYRLAPEHPLPAAMQDAYAAWQGLLERGYLAKNIVLAGDSAGGGLALGLLARLCQEHTPPAACVVFSPWTDLCGEGPSLAYNAAVDPVLPAHRFPELVNYIIGDMDPCDPVVSPLYAQFPDPPPVLIQHSLSEILCDDSLRMADRLRSFGGDVTVQSWPDTPHVWQLFPGYLPEAREAIRDAAAFITKRWP